MRGSESRSICRTFAMSACHSKAIEAYSATIDVSTELNLADINDVISKEFQVPATEPSLAMLVYLDLLVHLFPDKECDILGGIFEKVRATDPAAQRSATMLGELDPTISAPPKSDRKADPIENIAREEMDKTKQQETKRTRKRSRVSVEGSDEPTKKAKLHELDPISKVYNCEYCFCDLPNVQLYVEHLKQHRERELKGGLSRCNLCSKQFTDVIHVKWHWVLVHPKVFRH